MKINIGGGNFKKIGWKSVDFYHNCDIKMDLRNKTKLPINDNSVEIVFSSHTIEHMDDESVMFLLKECFRVMKIGATIRLSCPDAEKAFKAYEENDESFFNNAEVLTFGNDIGNKLIDFFASFGDSPGPQTKGTHKIPSDIIKNNYENLSKEKFIEWCVSQIPPNAKYKAHVNGFTFDKLKNFLIKSGFYENKIFKSTFRGSSVEELTNPLFDNRPNHSLFIESKK